MKFYFLKIKFSQSSMLRNHKDKEEFFGIESRIRLCPTHNTIM